MDFVNEKPVMMVLAVWTSLLVVAITAVDF